MDKSLLLKYPSAPFAVSAADSPIARFGLVHLVPDPEFLAPESTFPEAQESDLPTQSSPFADLQRSHLVVLDGRLDELDQLASQVLADIPTLVLDPYQDGVQQISHYLRYPDSLSTSPSGNSVGGDWLAPKDRLSYTVATLEPIQPAPPPPQAGEMIPPITDLHICCHGQRGELWLGGSWLSLASIWAYEEALQQWWSAPISPRTRRMTPQIWLYSCNVAAGETGAALLQVLQELTGATIHASLGRVGSGTWGGSWGLNVTITQQQGMAIASHPQNQPPFSPELLATYNGVFRRGLG